MERFRNENRIQCIKQCTNVHFTVLMFTLKLRSN